MYGYLKYLSVSHDLYHEVFFHDIIFLFTLSGLPDYLLDKRRWNTPINRTFYRNFKKTLQIVQVTEADSEITSV